MSGRTRLAACVATVLVVWLGVLPWIGRREPVADRIEWLEQKGIDPSAMYYTELDAMEPILQKLRWNDQP